MVEQRVIEPQEGRQALSTLQRLSPVAAETQQSWIHGDCQAAHFIMSEGCGSPEVAAVIDWADAQQGAPEMDLAVLTLFDDEVLVWVVEGYQPDRDLRSRLEVTLPLYRAVRAAGSLRWLETHGYHGHTWPIEQVRAFARL